MRTNFPKAHVTTSEHTIGSGYKVRKSSRELHKVGVYSNVISSPISS